MDTMMERFLAQNPDTAATLKDTLTAVRAAPYAEHHAGGMIVLAGTFIGTELYVKCHDSWSEAGVVVVHIYDAEDPDHQIVLEYESGAEAVRTFLAHVD
jgi:hypothetical protein